MLGRDDETDFEGGEFESDGAQIARILATELQDTDGIDDVEDLVRLGLQQTLDLLCEQRSELDRFTAEILSAEQTIYFDLDGAHRLAS